MFKFEVSCIAKEFRLLESFFFLKALRQLYESNGFANKDQEAKKGNQYL
jgi:hypothetical protein